jgi:sulfatase-like protein
MPPVPGNAIGSQGHPKCVSSMWIPAPENRNAIPIFRHALKTCASVRLGVGIFLRECDYSATRAVDEIKDGDWPAQVVPPKGAPNILLIMTDDQGYGVSGIFGGVIPTPSMDRIAQMGLRYTQFHSTALCLPTRADEAIRGAVPLPGNGGHPRRGMLVATARLLSSLKRHHSG